MRKLLFLSLFIASLFAAKPVVTAEWLFKHMKDPNILILDVSEPKVYKKSHIPGAINVPISLWRERHGLYLLIKPKEQIQRLLQNLGIDKSKHIVIYAHHSGKDMLKTSYVAWALELHGITETSLLDGGFKIWKKKKFPLSKESVTPSKSHYQVRFNPMIIIDKRGVRKAIGLVRMIDARPPMYYFGAKKQPALPRAGHIPTATSYFWKFSFNDDSTFKSKETLKKMLVEGLGLNPNEEVITYCTGGLETSMNWFVLHRILGFQKARLYDASMKEWANDEKMPLRKYRWE